MDLLKTADEFRRAMIDAGDRLAVVDFFATWCTPCQLMIPTLKAIAREFPDVAFYKVNVDTNEDTTETYNVTAMPTFILLRNGQVLDRMKGADAVALRALITKHASAPVG
jgi:thioredoxin 1